MTDEAKGGFSWLGGKGWWQVSREERYFCAELYRVLQGNEVKFVGFLNEKYGKRLNDRAEWELAYEVCFYRDWRKHWTDRGYALEKKSMKRTFDLVLFSTAQIVLFEAKAQQPYHLQQLDCLRKDKETFIECIREVKVSGPPEEILTAGIKSGRYEPRDTTLEHFDLRPLINWCDLAEWCTWDSHARNVFKRADCIYHDSIDSSERTTACA